MVVKAADDLFLDQSSMHHIQRFLGEMLVRRQNMLIDPMAKLRFYSDCNVAEFESQPCPAFLGSTPEGFNRYQFWFDLRDECFWLRGGIYWVSLVGIAPVQDTSYEAFWVTAGLPSQTPDRPECGQQPVGALRRRGWHFETRDDCIALIGQWHQGAPCTVSICNGTGGTLLGKRPLHMEGIDPGRV